MAQENVTSFPGKTVTPPPRKIGKRHPDTLLLSVVALWKRARAEARLEWAKLNEKTNYHTVSADHPTPHEALDLVAGTEAQMPMLEPRTSLGAMALLEVAIDIVSTKKTNPEASFGDGPVLEILVNVARALSCKEVPLKIEGVD
jgi:hypothetical protein